MPIPEVTTSILATAAPPGGAVLDGGEGIHCGASISASILAATGIDTNTHLEVSTDGDVIVVSPAAGATFAGEPIHPF